MKKAILTTALTLFATGALAVECPSTANGQLAQNKGQVWLLSKGAVDQGWWLQGTITMAKDSTPLQATSVVFTRPELAVFSAPTVCYYQYLDTAQQIQKLEARNDNVADTSKLDKSFVRVEDSVKCSLTAATTETAATTCEWQWK